MSKRKRMSRNQKILCWTLIVMIISGIIVPVILNFLKNQEVHSERVDVGDIDGDGTVVGDYAKVTVDKRSGVDAEFILENVIKTAEAKGRAELQVEQIKEQLSKAVERIKILEAEGNRPDAEKALEELRESGDMRSLQELLIQDRDEHRDALIQRNREIAAVAYLRGDIEIARQAVDEILKEFPDELFALNQSALIYKLRGKLKEAERDLKQVLELAVQANNDQARAASLGNLGVIYYMRGDLDKAEKMHKKALVINEHLGRKEGMAYQYGNLGLIYKMRGELDKAEEMHLKALEIDKKIGRLEGMANDYGNLGNVYYMRGDLDNAEEMHLKSLKIKEKIGLQEGIANSYGNLGLVYKQRGDIGKAREYWEKAVELYKRIGIPQMVEEVQGWIEGLKDK
ncbi:Photosystem I assembly protein Ycf3 [subsurface metagenome]